MFSAEERAQEMDQLLVEEEERVDQLEKELRKTREKQVRRKRKLWKERKSEAGFLVSRPEFYAPDES